MMSDQERLKRRMRGPGQDKRGRSKKGDRFVKLEHWMLKMPAWRALSPAARAIYVELAQRYNGSNNGEISMSVREAADCVNIAKDTASKAFHELEAKGFTRRHICGSFNWKRRHATTWVLTEFALSETPATKDFARWSPKSERDPSRRTDCPGMRTLSSKVLWPCALSVLGLGPWLRSCTVPRSQTAARI